MNDFSITETTETKGFLSRLRNSAKLPKQFKAEEDGSMTVFTLFIFILMLLIGGMAVDLIRFETQRAHLQNTLDSATLAATNLNSASDPTQLVQDFMDKNGFDPNLVTVNPVTVTSNGTLQARSVTASYDLDVNTIFMHMMGINELKTGTRGAAAQGTQAVEISLVLDISGSMGNNGKLDDLKIAAKNFVNQVIDPNRTVAVTSVSVIPYNHTVVVPQNMLTHLNTNDQIIIPPSSQSPYTGALTAYDRTSPQSQCVRFYNNEMVTADLQDSVAFVNDPNANYRSLRRITPTQPLDMMMAYDPSNTNSFNSPPNAWNYRCNTNRSSILPFETDIGTLETYFDNMTHGGWTSTDTGIKWGLALLDPGLRPMTNNMVSANDLPTTVTDRPLNYDASASMKILVVMTDGQNTDQFDVDAPYKNGPSRVWYSPSAATEFASNRDHDGYFVEMPDNPASQRFLRPLSPTSNSDGILIDALPDDATQLSYTELYARLSVGSVASLFNDVQGDPVARDAHLNAENVVQDNGSANARMNGNGSSTYGLCDVAKVNNDVLVYTVAFQAGAAAEGVMRECASGVNGAGFYFPASDGTALNNAFSAIAGSITKLRLTQ